MSAAVTEPGRLTVAPDGSMAGRSAGYRKHLGDMAGVYRDDAGYAARLAELGADHLVYSVEEHRADDGPGALIIGTSTLLPGTGAASSPTNPRLPGVRPCSR